MAKRLQLSFLGLLAIASIIVILNSLQFLTNEYVDSGLSNASIYFAPVHLSNNDENKNVAEKSYDLTVKQTRKRIHELILSKLRTSNNTNRFSHDSAHRSLTSFSILATFHPSLRSRMSATPKPPAHVVPFHYASNAVRQWNSGYIRQLTVADLPSINVTGADCTALFSGNTVELIKAIKFESTYKKEVVEAEKFIQQTYNCARFVADRRYVTWPVNREEAEFPIAFSILMYKDVEQFERLLRAVYRPQNLYCVHVDSKSTADIHSAVVAIAECFENVFVLHPSVDVLRGMFTVLEPELACMNRLLQRNKKWRYFINLTGQEFPLKTNWQIVRILKAFNGSNNMEGTIERFVFLKKILVLLFTSS